MLHLIKVHRLKLCKSFWTYNECKGCSLRHHLCYFIALLSLLLLYKQAIPIKSRYSSQWTPLDFRYV